MQTKTMDLHIHTTASDGASTPAQLVDEASKAGLKVISLTDHESIQGLLSLKDSENQGIEIIPGVELVTTYNDREIHLLGYCFDVENRGFASRIRELRQERNKTYLESVDKFNKLGFKISRSAFIDIADQEISLGKNHIILALAEKGYIKTWEQVIDFLQRYLGYHGLAQVSFDSHPFFEAVDFLRSFKGIPVLAHPGLIGDDNLVLELLAKKLVELEVYYYYFGTKRDQWILKYQAMAEEMGLLATGGSDYHGLYSPDIKLGSLAMPDTILENLREQQRKIKGDVS